MSLAYCAIVTQLISDVCAGQSTAHFCTCSCDATAAAAAADDDDDDDDDDDAMPRADEEEEEWEYRYRGEAITAETELLQCQSHLENPTELFAPEMRWNHLKAFTYFQDFVDKLREEAKVPGALAPNPQLDAAMGKTERVNRFEMKGISQVLD